MAEALPLMSDPSAKIESSKGKKMYLVKNGEQLLASCHTHEMAFDFFMTYGGFFEEDLKIEREYA
jgi:hypothetical protein